MVAEDASAESAGTDRSRGCIPAGEVVRVWRLVLGRFSIPDPPVQSLDLGYNHRPRGCARRITRRQAIADLFEKLKSHRDMEPVKNRRFQNASIGENAPESRTIIGEGRRRGVAGAANRIEGFPYPTPPHAARQALLDPGAQRDLDRRSG
jgi:hypothetical protein